jgi:23S rRNA (pseudouridine1915-N3)-methyltransferase
VVAEYEGRLGRYWRFRVVVVEAGTGRGRGGGAEAVRRAEEARILARLPAAGEVVVLTREGSAMGSRELGAFLEGCALRSVSEVAFVVGGAFGLGDLVLEEASRRFSLSALTLPHELARLVLTEQLYRAGTILRNEPYHKGS